MNAALAIDTDSAALHRAVSTLETIILGKPAQVRLCLACLLARGHLLIEDVPGVGKTTLAHALAHVLGLEWQRVQFTSDLLPADIIGVSVFDRACPDPRNPDPNPRSRPLGVCIGGGVGLRSGTDHAHARAHGSETRPVTARRAGTHPRRPGMDLPREPHGRTPR